jgi:hypothetical protein
MQLLPYAGLCPFVVSGDLPTPVSVPVSFMTLWVPNWSSTSCDLGVFVYQPVE